MAKTTSASWVIITFIMLSVVVVVLFVVELLLGSASIPVGDILSILGGGEEAEVGWRLIVIDWRLPRACTALMMGASLAVSGLLMQTLFRNPLAGPFILGINSGASLGVGLLVLGGSALGWNLGESYFAMIAAAMIGSASILLLVMAFSLRVRSVFSLLIIGMMFGAFASAIVSVLQYFSSPEQLQAFTFWTFGSLGGVHLKTIPILAGIIGIGLIAAFALSKYMNAYLLGENYARALGVSILRSRLAIILVTCLLAGVATAFCGPIAFVGLAVPHLARNLYKSSNHLVLVPACILIGSALLLACDIIAQMPSDNTTLPINAVTSLFGAPIVIWIIFYNRKLKQSF
jgi:iron complex transport system permease protein